MNKKEQRLTIQTEVDAGYLYQQLAELESDASVAGVYQALAEIESRHAKAFLKRTRASEPSTELPPPSRRAQVLAWIARRFGTQWVLPSLADLENRLSQATIRQKTALGVAVTGREATHGRVLKTIQKKATSGLGGGMLAKFEGRHRAVGGNALRAAVLGANDGLVSNFSLVMGVAGAAPEGKAILIAGFAGLLAGAISMALGEWLSVQSSRELYVRQIAIEAEELANSPEEEAMELALIYQAKGVAPQQAKEIAQRIISDEETAIETLAREELGVDPEELGGSAWEAALTSFILFTLGAIIPVAPFLLTPGSSAIPISFGVSALGLFGIGAAITLMTGRGVLFSGLRQMAFGLAAAGVTFGIGKLLGVAVS